MSPNERKEWRRQRLVDLLHDHYHDNQSALASAADIPATLVSRYMNAGKGIGERMRDKIEMNTKRIGWFAEPGDSPSMQVNKSAPASYLSQSRSIALAPTAVTLQLDADCLLVWQQLQQLPPDERDRWRAMLEIAAGEARLAKLDAKKVAPTVPADKDQLRPKTRDPA